MAARVLHFGEQPCPALPLLRSAGYAVECCGSVLQFQGSLEGGSEPDAVSMTDEMVSDHPAAVSLARAHTSAPLILFRKTDRNWFPDVEYNPVEPEFDLIVPRAAPPAEWLCDVADAIEQSRTIRALSEQISQDTSRLLQESSRLRQKSSRLLGECRDVLQRSRFEQARAELLKAGIDAPEYSTAGARDLLQACVDCKKSFVFPAGEQLFFREKGLQDPTHCPQCRRKPHESARFALTRVICSQCGSTTMVPFKPTQDRPVLCRACFKKSLA